MKHKAWCNVEEVSYNFSRSSIKFQGHAGWKIDDLNPIWVRLLLGRSQLSNYSDLPCCLYSVKLDLGSGVQTLSWTQINLLRPFCLPFVLVCMILLVLLWRHNERDGVWNHRRLDYLLNRLFRCRSQKASKPRVTGFWEGNPPVADGFPSQKGQ